MILGICGACQAGKSTVADMLCDLNPEYKSYSFADALKEEVSKTYPKEELGWNGKDWTGPKSVSGRAQLNKRAEKERKENPACFLNVVKDKIEQEKPIIAVIADVRFINELEWVSEEGNVVLVRNQRKEKEYIDNFLLKGDYHESELQWRVWIASKSENSVWTNTRKGYIVIHNNDSLDDLRQRVFDLDYSLTFWRLALCAFP